MNSGRGPCLPQNESLIVSCLELELLHAESRRFKGSLKLWSSEVALKHEASTLKMGSSFDRKLRTPSTEKSPYALFDGIRWHVHLVLRCELINNPCRSGDFGSFLPNLVVPVLPTSLGIELQNECLILPVGLYFVNIQWIFSSSKMQVYLEPCSLLKCSYISNLKERSIFHQ